MPPRTRTETAPAPATSPAVPETPLEDTNPPGAPEGVEQPSAAPEGHATHTGPADAVQPTEGDFGSTTVTTEDEPPTPTGPARQGPTGSDPLDAHNRLVEYLVAHHPADLVQGEHVEDTAVRLLTRLGASSSTGARCQAPYCNYPALHAGEHGWVHVEPTQR